MYFRAVGSRCAIRLSDFIPEFGSLEELESRLNNLGYSITVVEPVTIARSVLGIAQYRRGARLREAPTTFDCSSLVKWVYGQMGIWIPRRSIQQRRLGRPVALSTCQAGDLIFSSGWRNYYVDRPEEGIGHVGLVTGTGTVIQAANRRLGIVEGPIEAWLGKKFRGVSRLLPSLPEHVYTIETNPVDEVETSDDILWRLRIRSASLPKGSN